VFKKKKNQIKAEFHLKSSPLKKIFCAGQKTSFVQKIEKKNKKICTSPIKTLRELNHQNGFAINQLSFYCKCSMSH
jgi:hypothetical protein